MNWQRKSIATIMLVGLMALFLNGCSSDKASSEKNAAESGAKISAGAAKHQEIKYRRMPTATSDLFEAGIVPILKKEGYKLKPVEITDSVQRETALSEDEIDMHVDAHAAYIKSFNKNQKTDLAFVLPIPTVPTGIYSGTKKELSQLSAGDKIAFPNDPSNEARSLQLLSQIGFIKMQPGVEPTKYKLSDIAANPKNIEFVEMKGPNIASVRTDFAFIILRGSDAYNSKIDFNSALSAEKQEDILADNMMQLIVNGKHKDEQWVKDIIAAYKSDEFKKFMQKQSKFWILPDYLRK